MGEIEIALIIAVGCTVAVSAGLVLALHRPLRRFYIKTAKDIDLSLFWTLFADFMLILFPLGALLLGTTAEQTHWSLVVLLGRYFRWSIVGLLMAFFTVACTVVGGVRPLSGTVDVEPRQVDDLQRLLAKVDQIRAREILRRAPDSGESKN